MKKYKNLIFDIGGVLLSYQFEKILIDIGYTREEAIRIDTEIFESGYWEPLDRGDYTLDEVIRLCMEKYPDDAEGIQYLLTHHEGMSIPRDEIWERVHELKLKGYKIYILSNYSDDLLSAHCGDAPFWKDVDGEIISCREGCIKPECQIYERILSKYQLIPEECIFFDDRQDNVNGAINCGIDAIKINSEEQLLEILSGL